MERREFIGAVIAAGVVAGCTSDDGGGEDGEDPGDTTTTTGGGSSDNGGESGENTGDTITTTAGGTTTKEGVAPPTLVDHRIGRGPTGGYDMVVTVKNTTNQELNRAIGEVAVFNDTERLATGRAAAIDLPPGVSAEKSALLEQFGADTVTHYTITMVGETEDYADTRSREHEFTGEEFRERLR